MAHCNTILNQLAVFFPRHDFEKLASKHHEGQKFRSCNRHDALLSRLFNLAIKWQFVENSPCKSIKKQKEAGGKERYLSDDELKRFLSALDEVEQNVSAYALRFLLFTGIRMSEALQLEWQHVDLEKAVCTCQTRKQRRAELC